MHRKESRNDKRQTVFGKSVATDCPKALGLTVFPNVTLSEFSYEAKTKDIRSVIYLSSLIIGYNIIYVVSDHASASIPSLKAWRW